MISISDAKAAKELVKSRLAFDSNVTGVGITKTDGDYAVQVLLLKEEKQTLNEIGGVTIKYEVTGKIKKRAA
jgi:hypothetical protein